VRCSSYGQPLPGARIGSSCWPLMLTVGSWITAIPGIPGGGGGGCHAAAAAPAVPQLLLTLLLPAGDVP
jgi:hypothetical protein